MADIKVLKVNLDGLYQEHSEAADSIKVASLKTATNELTDAKLGDLVGGGDASAQHNHASLYFDKAEFINASTGVASAAKPIVTDAAGKIDPTLIEISDFAHDDMIGVANSTAHLAFPLLVGGRDFSAIQQYDAPKTFTTARQLVDKQYVDNSIAGVVSGDNWLQSIHQVGNNPTTLTVLANGDRILVQGVGVGAFAGHDNSIATYVLATTSYTFQEFAAIPVGSTVRLIDTDKFYLRNAANWTRHAMESTKVEQNGPLFFSAEYELDLALGLNGGLKITPGYELATDVNYLAGAGLKNDGSDKLAIDFSTTYTDHKALAADNLNASIVPFSSVNFLATKVNTALDELYAKVDAGTFPKYIAAAAIVKGDLVYISAAGFVSKYSTLTDNSEVVGIALANAAMNAEVVVAAIDIVIPGALTGAVAGARYYWNGALSTSMSTTSGHNVWLAGVAKNATDLIVKVRHIRKNA